LLSILAGVYIALAAVGAAAAQVSISSASVAKLIGACVFPAGLAMIVLGGGELFTGNCLLLQPLLAKRIGLKGLFYNLSLVYVGNFIGSVLIALLVAFGHSLSLFDGALAQSTIATAQAKLALSFSDAFLRGILCNILVCAAVWMSLGAKSSGGKLLALYLPVMLFVLCGFEHCVANMYSVPAAIFASAAYGIAARLSWGAFLLNNLLPVTLGNIVGGMGLGLFYWVSYKD
jgi:formate/nitrite transporter